MKYIPEITQCLMVIITALYLSATIIMCVFNGKSAKAAKEQTQELKNQFYAVNRPVLTVNAVYLEKGFWIIRIRNEGSQTAMKTRLKLSQSFIDSVPEEEYRKALETNREKERTVGVGQELDLIFGTEEYTRLKEKADLCGEIVYCGINGMEYTDDFEIDIESYAVVHC